MTNTTSSTPTTAPHKILNSPMRELVRVVLYFVRGGEADLSEIRQSISYKFDDDNALPRNWKTQVRDVLKHDPEIEKTEDGTWVLRTQDESVQ